MRERKVRFYEKYIKRSLDFWLSLLAIVVLSSVILVTALLVRVKLGSPVLFCQIRPGKGGKLFRMYKFRSMTDEKDAEGKLLPDEVRLTSFGKKLRSTSLDELPELFNILKGDMSIVGPRPQLVRDMVFMTPEQNRRHEVRQGLTGLAQVKGRNAITWEEKLAYDIQYVDNISFWNDVKIIFDTVKSVFAKEGISAEGMATAEDFGDYLLREGKVTERLYEERQEEAIQLVRNVMEDGKMDGWRYYNHAVMPTTAPHVNPDVTAVESGKVWKEKGVMLARWTTDFDCGCETEWWYVIKKEPLDISSLKSKRRYEINKGKKNFECKEIDPKHYKDEIYDIQVSAYEKYPLKYRPTVDKEKLFIEIDKWNWYKVYGAFDKGDGKLSGYALLNRNNDYIYLAVQKVYPRCELYAINAAIVAYILEEHEVFLSNGGYISDGARNIQHETHFQDYLEKYFDFRKAYCKLHVVYNPKIRLLVKVLYPFRKVLKRFDSNSMIHRINGVLFMESIRKSERE